MARYNNREDDHAERGSTRVLRDRKREFKRDREEHRREAWDREDFLQDLHRVTSPMTDAINADPKEAERLRKSREQVREGEVHWGVEDEDDKDGGDDGA